MKGVGLEWSRGGGVGLRALEYGRESILVSHLCNLFFLFSLRKPFLDF